MRKVLIPGVALLTLALVGCSSTTIYDKAVEEPSTSQTPTEESISWNFAADGAPFEAGPAIRGASPQFAFDFNAPGLNGYTSDPDSEYAWQVIDNEPDDSKDTVTYTHKGAYGYTNAKVSVLGIDPAYADDRRTTEDELKKLAPDLDDVSEYDFTYDRSAANRITGEERTASFLGGSKFTSSDENDMAMYYARAFASSDKLVLIKVEGKTADVTGELGELERLGHLWIPGYMD